jgi:hypothetical protein
MIVLFIIYYTFPKNIALISFGLICIVSIMQVLFTFYFSYDQMLTFYAELKDNIITQKIDKEIRGYSNDFN